MQTRASDVPAQQEGSGFLPAKLSVEDKEAAVQHLISLGLTETKARNFLKPPAPKSTGYAGISLS